MCALNTSTHMAIMSMYLFMFSFNSTTNKPLWCSFIRFFECICTNSECNIKMLRLIELINSRDREKERVDFRLFRRFGYVRLCTKFTSVLFWFYRSTNSYSYTRIKKYTYSRTNTRTSGCLSMFAHSPFTFRRSRKTFVWILRKTLCVYFTHHQKNQTQL